jgi:hypothetical protein
MVRPSGPRRNDLERRSFVFVYVVDINSSVACGWIDRQTGDPVQSEEIV